ncbi:MAG TPA: hypothetical protein VM509_03735, partial [Planctomycetota bacterium]|nr:hypothetical protein [Planctomycetota bacterium]
MSERSTDALEMLLPEAAPQFWQRAQRVTTFLRLLSDDARASGGASVAVNLARARGVFERSAVARRVRVHEELLRHHLEALVGCDSFAHYGDCDGALQSAWSEIEELRADSPWILHVPAPGEGAASVVARLLEGLQRSGASAARLELWRARCRRATQGPEAGAAAFEALLEAHTSGAAPRNEPSAKFAALAGVVECLLDRSAVRAARARFEAEGQRVQGDARLRRLCMWTRLLAGDDEGARSLAASGPTRARIPRPLAELRLRAPAKAPMLAGQASTDEALRLEPALAIDGELARHAAEARTRLGATLLTAWVLEGPGRAHLAAHALAPAHRGKWAAWLAAHEGACADPRQGECQLLGDARPRIVHLDGRERAVQGQACIDPAAILATALVPLCDERGDVRGWLNLEFEHHLVPSAACLERTARAWAARFFPSTTAGLESVPATVVDESSAAACVLRGFVDGLALKTTQRRWSAFEVHANGLALVAQGGGAFASEEDGRETAQENARGEGRAVARAAETGRSVAFTEADARLGLHSDAASGVAVPLELRGRVAGVWLVESTRRRDFSAADVQRFEARARVLAAELFAAQFRAWHRERYKSDVLVEAKSASAGLSAEQLVALAASRAPIALSGPLGSGRRTLARRLHFESPLRAAPLVRIPADRAELERALDSRADARGLIVERVLELALAEQARIAQLLEERAAAPSRVYLLLERPLRAAVEQGVLAPELAWIFSRVELELAPLAQRRTEIGPLAQMFAAHFAAEEGVRAPTLDDGALACLWRQPWSGNVRELAQWMYRLVLCHPGGEIDAAAVEAMAARFGHALVQRIPSRHPDREL